MITNFLGQTPEEVAGVLKEAKRHTMRNCAILTAIALTALLIVTDSALVASISFMGVIAAVYVATSDF